MSSKLFVAPGGIPVPSGAALVFEVYNSVATAVVRVKYQMVDHTGKPLAVSQEDIIPTSDRIVTRKTIKLIEGTLLSVNINLAANVAMYRGQCYVLAYIQFNTGAQASNPITLTILQGYLVAHQTLSYPGTPFEGMLEGKGYEHSISIGTPGAGTNFQYNLPTHAAWYIRALHLDLTTNATVASRYMRLFESGEGISPIRFISVASNSQPASSVYEYMFQHNILGNTSSWNLPATYLCSLPINFLLYAENDMIGSSVTNLQAGDVIGGIELQVEEYILPVSGGGLGGGGGGGGGPA